LVRATGARWGRVRKWAGTGKAGVGALGAEKVGAARNRALGDRGAVKGLAPNAERALVRGTVKDLGARLGGKVLRGDRSSIAKVVADGVRVKDSIVRVMKKGWARKDRRTSVRAERKA